MPDLVATGASTGTAGLAWGGLETAAPAPTTVESVIKSRSCSLMTAVGEGFLAYILAGFGIPVGP